MLSSFRMKSECILNSFGSHWTIKYSQWQCGVDTYIHGSMKWDSVVWWGGEKSINLVFTTKVVRDEAFGDFSLLLFKFCYVPQNTNLLLWKCMACLSSKEEIGFNRPSSLIVMSPAVYCVWWWVSWEKKVKRGRVNTGREGPWRSPEQQRWIPWD